MFKSFISKSDNKTIYLSVFLHLAFFCVIMLMENAILKRLAHIQLNQVNFIDVKLEFEELALPAKSIESKSQQPLIPDEAKEAEELKVADLSIKNAQVPKKPKELPRYEQLLSHHFKNLIKSKVIFPDKNPVTILIEVNKQGNIISYEFTPDLANTTFKNALIEKIKLADPVPIPPHANANKETAKYLIDLLPPQ
jgi:TonB C terminal